MNQKFRKMFYNFYFPTAVNVLFCQSFKALLKQSL